MKTKFTLLAVALLAVCAFANTWKASEETPVAAGSILIDDELVTAKTVYETTLKSAMKEIAGEAFTHYIQVRVDVAPTADEPNGTDKGGSTPIILTAKKDLTLKIYYRRQSTSQNEDSGVYASNDGKDLKIVDQADPTTVLDGTLTIVEETEDYKYAWVTKEYELAEGKTYTIWGRGTTINYYGMTYEGKEPPAPIVGEAIELSPASGDISAELAAIMENNPYPASITINLAANGDYTVSQAIETVGNLTIQGDASAPATISASGLTAPMVQVKSDLAAFQPNEATGFYDLGNISISNVKVTGLAQQLFYGNKVKALYKTVSLDNSIVEVAGGNKTVIDFNSGGVAETVSISNSTIYGNPQHTGQLYSSQSGQKATDAGLEKQTISIINSTLYNIAYSKNVNTHRQANQTWLAYELKNSMIVDCGKQGQFVKGLNGGQSGKNPIWMIDGNSFQWTVDGVLTDISANEETADEEEPVSNNVEGVAVFANDITTGDFTFDQCPQNEACIGDPRWLVEVKKSFEGKYYLYNVGAKKYWGCANDWGTRASLVDHPEYVTLAQISEGVYTLESQVSNGGTSYYFGGDYMDGNPVNLTITKVDDENYTIANEAGELYGYDGSSTILGKNVAAGNNALWKIISEEEMLASLNTATASAPVDATFLIIDAKFGRNNRNVDAWVVSEDCTNKNLTGGNSNKHCAESYHSTFTISQVLSNVPNGVYAFEAQGFYRQDGSDNDNLAQFFINDETAVVPLKTGAENSMADACASFENGLYKIEPLYVEVKDGQITVGIKNETNPNLWVIWDNFVLTYYGADASLDEVKNAAIIAELDELRAKATELQGQPEVAKVNEGLTNALTETAEVSASSPTEEIHAAIDKLKAAIEAAEASISAKNTLAAMKELIDNTNVYTEEAYNEYYGQWVAKYEEGTLTKTEAAGLQNPFVVTGWHSSITVDNFLLSAWDTNPDFNDAPYYINSWSVEGESDGSDFKVPFFEYWTGDANSLGERTLTATMANLPAGVYNVSALVRVRVKDGNSDAPNGITLQANDGEAVPVTNGTQIGTSQYYLDTFTAQGIVGEDGILKIKFNVAADNNISWLSFKNVKYVFDPIGDAIVLNVEDGKDIVAELATAMETNKFPESITINLAAGGNYAATSSIVANCPITINGDEANPATIDATALTAPMLLISNELVDNLLGDNGFYQLGNIAISNVKVKGLAQQLIYGNKVKAQYGTLSLTNSIIEVAGGSKTVFDFNGGGVVETLAINNSTFYGNPQHTGQLYSSQSGQKATDAGLEKQTISITNSTLYNIAYSKNVNTHRQANQTWLAYELKNSMIIDCGKQGQFVKGLNGGQSGKNPTWMIDGNSFQWTVDGALTDISANEETADEEEPVTNNVEGVAVFANDITTGDFTFGQCPQNEACIGDPRWLVEVVEVPFDGKYYLYNVGAKKYWGCANDWGTRASMVDHPEYVTLAQISEGVYTLESQVSNGGTSYYFGGDYMDGSPVNLTIAKVGSGIYTIANEAGELYGYDGSSTILGKNVAAGDNALWQIISEEEMLASLNTATVSAPVDATFLIIDAKFGRNNRNVDAWVVSEDCTNKNLTGGNSNKHCAESYHSTFTISQVLSNVPNGVYAFEAQGFYRQDGSDNDNLAQFFINNESTLVPLKTGNENSMADACASFENGLYKAEPLYVQVEDGQITVGIKNELNPNLWVIWDNFVLTYYGADASLDEVKNAAIIAELAELRARATELQGQAEVDAVNNALVIAMAETTEVSGASPAEEILAAIDKLKAAIESAEASISAKNTLAAMKELIDNTNVYTEEAYNEYYGQWVVKYEEGTLTKSEAAGLQNPFVVTGWHSSITVDNFLLSAWDTNPDFNDAPYYINSWSVEGESDGSDFKVPFFEYWTGDANSLGERTLTATMTNLPAGIYDISALVRVRVKDGNSDAPNGITLQANDGEAVPVTTGAQIGSSQYYLDTFTAQGEVGEDGVLKIKFNVAADNNISWLSFKNVNYVFNPIATGVDGVNAVKGDGAYYNLQGVRVATPRRGVYIKNGKKVVVK